MKHTLPDRVRIGIFEVDLRAGELRQGLRTICLQEQGLFVLRLLVEQAGEIVTREELKQKLWPNDTVVDFDLGINAAIRRLRRALGDFADEPKYIETVARRGYRLLVAVERLDDSSSSDQLRPSPDRGPSTPLRSARDDKREEGDKREETSDHSLIGKRVSHYRVLSVIGGGGMGLVYEAEDLKLGRRVALKFLPEELADNAVALQRFEREARAASSLNHPNICTIHEIEEHENQSFMVMELLEGETLRDRLAALKLTQQGFPIEELINVAVQMCDGLSAAHAKGIIHRDIKPANLFLTTTGQVKILDFGLAKLIEVEEAREQAMSAAASRGTTRSSSPDLTITGLTMGTAGYMSPEQVCGEKLDARTDLFSFGLVLYEMASGYRAFSGETAAVVKDAIQNQSPVPLRERNPALPAKLECIVDRAIEKDRERRYQSAVEMRADLLALSDETEKIELRKSGKSLYWKWIAAALLVCVSLAAAGTWHWRNHKTAKLTEQDTIVTADFENKTGDPVFDETLKQALAIQLGQSPFFNILSDHKVRETLKLMNLPAGEPLTEKVSQEICLRTNSKAMLAGSITKFDTAYVIGIRAVDCKLGESFAEVKARAANKEAVLKSLDRAALTLRTKLGESLSSVERFATPLSQATTPSLEALKAYTLGMKIAHLQGPTAAVPLLRRAVELDPNFAAAYHNIGVAYFNLGQGERAQQYLRRAFELRERVIDRERFMIESAYYQDVSRELDKAAQTYKTWHETYPRDAAPVGNLGNIYSQLGDPHKFLEYARATKRLEPAHAIISQNLGAAYMNLNQLDEAEEVFKEAERRGLSAEYLLDNRYQLAFVKGDKAEMAQMVAASKGKPGTEDVLLAAEADTEAWYGRLKSARKLTEQAIDSAKQNDASETAAVYTAAAALREVAAGNRQQAVSDAKLALKLSQDRDVRAIAALTLAQTGDLAAIQTLTAGLERDGPLDTLVQRYWLPTINATVSIEQTDPETAVRTLAAMGNQELGTISASFNVFLCPAYVRGQAYLLLGDGKAAAAEFQKFIDHYGLITNFPWGALARLDLARAYALEAQTDPAARERARTAYQNFLTLWKDADPDIPIYKQAKAEYAKLR